MNEVVVVGAGIAGTAAALAANARGARVMVVVGPPGATHLAPGTIDGGAQKGDRTDVLALLTALGGFDLDDCLVATLAGIVRKASGRDRGLLDLACLHRGEILLPRTVRQGWDADALVRMLSEAPLAVERGLRFRAVDLAMLRMADERVVPDATIAARHDDPARLSWLAEKLRAVLAAAPATKAVLLPPCLGAVRERATELSSAIGVPCGEVAVGLSGPAGFRFAAARDRAFEAHGIRTLIAFARDVVEQEDAVMVELEDGDTLRAETCILATGGLVGGGLVYAPSETSAASELPNDPRPYLHASIGQVPVGVRGQLLDVPGSLFGVAPELLAWPFVEDGDLERAGVLVSREGLVRGLRRIYACGELLADRPRTWLDAARSGIAAGSAVRLFVDEAGRARSSG